MQTPTSQIITLKATTYTFNLPNTAEINDYPDMGDFRYAINDIVEAYDLPSYSYPEVYEFLITQRGCRFMKENSASSVMVFGIYPNIGMNEMEAFCKAVNDLAKFENTYFQRKNCAVTIAEQELRAAEHTMAQAQIKVSAAKQASAELKH